MYVLCIINDADDHKISKILFNSFNQNEIDVYSLNLTESLAWEKNVQNVQNAIEYSANVVFLITRKFSQSKLCHISYDYALKMKKNIIFVLLEELSLKDDANCFKIGSEASAIEPYKIPAYDLLNETKDEISELYDAIKKAIIKRAHELFEEKEMYKKLQDFNIIEVDTIYKALKVNKEVFEKERVETRKFMLEMEKKKTNLDVSESNILMYVLGKTFEKNGYEMVMSKKSIENDDLLQLHTKLWLHGFLFGLQVYKTVFEIDGDKTEINAQKIKSDPVLLKEFLEQFTTFINENTGIDAKSLNVIDIVDGSIAVIYSSINPISNDVINRPAQKSTITLPLTNTRLRYEHTADYRLIEQIVVPHDFINPQYYMDYTNPFYKDRVTTRGQENYYFPYGWKRYALNLTRFGYSDLNWLTMNNSDNEWVVAYYAVKGNSYMDPIQASRNMITTNNIRAGRINPSQHRIDINPRSSRKGLPCGVGIYCTPKIEIVKQNASEVQFGNRIYRIALQCRINPIEYRNPGEYNFYIVNNSADMRPYGILLNCNEWSTN